MIYREKELPRSKVPDKVKREGIQSTGRQSWLWQKQGSSERQRRRREDGFVE